MPKRALDRRRAVSALGDRRLWPGGLALAAGERPLLDDASRRSCAGSYAAGRPARGRSRTPSCGRWRWRSCAGRASTPRSRRCCATLAPRAHRARAVRGDRRAGAAVRLSRRADRAAAADPLGEGERLFAAYTDALAVGAETATAASRAGRRRARQRDDLRWRTAATCRRCRAPSATRCARLPALPRSRRPPGERGTRRAGADPDACRRHAREWHRSRNGQGARPRARAWSGESSSPARRRRCSPLHALIAAAADPARRAEDAAEIEAAYLSTCAVADPARRPRRPRAGRALAERKRALLGWPRTAGPATSASTRTATSSRRTLTRASPASGHAGARPAERAAPHDDARRRRRLLHLRPRARAASRPRRSSGACSDELKP